MILSKTLNRNCTNPGNWEVRANKKERKVSNKEEIEEMQMEKEIVWEGSFEIVGEKLR